MARNEKQLSNWPVTGAKPPQAQDASRRSGGKHEKTAATLIATTLLSLITTQASAQDAAAGEKVFQKCRVCHQIGDTAKNSVGPH